MVAGGGPRPGTGSAPAADDAIPGGAGRTAAGPAGANGRLGLVRLRLLDELASARYGRLALVISPAGSGKTTLLAQYAAAWAGPVGWWQLETASASKADVIHAFGRHALGLAGDGSLADVQDLLAALRAADRPDTLMVVDDVQLLTEAGAWEALETITVHSPSWLHILAAGRRIPEMNLSRFELADTRLLGAEQLRFRSWEVEDLLRDVYGEPLPPEDVAALTRRVGGWAAGLHLFHLSTRGQPLAQRRRTVAALHGRSSLTRDYLTRTVLSELPAALREFLLRTCVFEVLTPERCEGLLGRPGTSRRYLEQLERLHAFTSTPDGGQTYRYHELLRIHLTVALTEEIGEGAARRWHARCAALLVAEGALVEATRAYARAEEWAMVRELLAKLGTQVAEEGLEPWRDLLPGWLMAEDPWLMLAEGRQLLCRGQIAAAVGHLNSAEHHFSDHRARAWCRATRRIAATWLPGKATAPGHYSAALRQATRQSPALAASCPGEWGGRAGPLVKAIGSLLAGDVAGAGRWLFAEAADDTDVAELGTRLLRACWRLACGSPDAGQKLSDVVAAAERAELPWLARMARAGRALDGSSQGMSEARAVVRECDREGDQWGGILARVALCLTRSAGLTSEAPDVGQALELRQRCQAIDAPVLEAWAQALVALAAAATGHSGTGLEVKRAENLARSHGVPGVRVAALAAARRLGAAGTDPRSLAGQHGLPLAIVDRWAEAAAKKPRFQVAEPSVTVDVRCFGGFRMRIRDQALDLSAIKPRTRMALRLLAMHAGRPVHRETLIEAFWRDLPPDAATRNLHVALSSLRTFLQPASPPNRSGLVARTGNAYRLALPDDGYSDVAEFLTALDEARRARRRGDTQATADLLSRAVLAYSGELFPEDGPEEWVVYERESLRCQAAEAASGLAALALAGGMAEDAVAAAQRCVQIDRYCDAGWQLLVDGLDRLQRPAAAARARHDYAELLDSLRTSG